MDEFIAAVEEAMSDQDLSIGELARRAGVARPYLSRVLSGYHECTLVWAEKIADALGIEIQYHRH